MLTGVIPQSGRMCYAALSRLGAIAGEDLSATIELLEHSKLNATANLGAAHNYLRGLQEQGYPLTIRPDRQRAQRPYRPVFLGMDIQLGGVDVRIEGDEPHNCSSLIRLSEADFAITGLDELLATMQPYLGGNARVVTRWGNFNYGLSTLTDVRVAGSANLKYADEATGRAFQDFVGFFVMGNKESRQEYDNLETVLASGKRVYVKGRYEGVVLNAFPRIKTMPVRNVEDAVQADKHGVGIEIVHSGRTARRKGLVVYGAPLFLSEGLLVVDYGEYQRNPELQKAALSLQPQGFFSDERLSNFVDWYLFLEKNLGSNWINPPDIATMFSGSTPNVGLRPYTLESRGWKPSDDLPPDKRLAEKEFIMAQEQKLNYLCFSRSLRTLQDELAATGASPEKVARQLAEALPDECQRLAAAGVSPTEFVSALLGA